MCFVDEFFSVSWLNSMGELVIKCVDVFFRVDFLGDFRGRFHGLISSMNLVGEFLGWNS